jgi:alkylation response protein AidB-like acyl-CoA dehydrogenase
MNKVQGQQRWVEEVRKFAHKEIRPRARELDIKGEYPRDLIDRLAEKRFLLPSVSREYGGLGLDPVNYGLFLEEIGKACCSTRGLITVNNALIGETIARWGNEEQKREWLPLMADGKKIGAFALTEPDVGSDARNVKTVYTTNGDRYAIKGRKKWISFGGIADFFLVISSSFEKTTAFLINRDLPGVRTRHIQGMLAGRASHIAEIEFDNVTVPSENVLGRVGVAFSLCGGNGS